MSNQKQGKSGGGGGNSSGGVAGQHSGGMRAEAKKTKAVFKHVLETPFSIPWYLSFLHWLTYRTKILLRPAGFFDLI
jgi:hypothetical protein